MLQRFDKEHDNPDDCQLIVAITGTREHIVSMLKYLLKDAAKNGKPVQGYTEHPLGHATVITPIWNGIPR